MTSRPRLEHLVGREFADVVELALVVRGCSFTKFICSAQE
jgi:hypothetical protein